MDGLAGEGTRFTFVASSLFWVEGSPGKFSVKGSRTGNSEQVRYLLKNTHWVMPGPEKDWDRRIYDRTPRKSCRIHRISGASDVISGCSGVSSGVSQPQ